MPPDMPPMSILVDASARRTNLELDFCVRAVVSYGGLLERGQKYHERLLEAQLLFMDVNTRKPGQGKCPRI